MDRKTFVYTDKGAYESRLRLYELEGQLEECGFFRASRSCLIQLRFVRSLKRDINRRIRVTMENGETKTWSNGLECREVFDCTESNRIIVKQFRM